MSTEDNRSFTPESIPEDGPVERNDDSPRVRNLCNERFDSEGT